MNIFALDAEPVIAAQLNNSRHVIKMVVELQQLLSTAHRILDGKQERVLSASGRRKTVFVLPDERERILYAATHVNHPSAVWVRSGSAQYEWAHKHLIGLCDEYTYRYGKTHDAIRTGRAFALVRKPDNIKSDVPFTLPTPAMPDYCKVPGDVVASYRKYYNEEKQHLSSWHGKINSRSVPTWFIMKGKP